jgi:HEAT repeats
MAAAAPAQSLLQTQGLPKIGTVDFYGLHKVTESNLRKALGVREGDPLPASKGDVEEKLDTISGVTESHLEAICCENGTVILYVGIEERGAPHFELHPAPEGDAPLPEEISAAYQRFLTAFDAAARRGSTDEDLTKGYSRMADLTARAIQDMFPAMAADHLIALRAVLHDSDNEADRAVAAYVIGYAPDSRGVVNDLQYALRDADPGVRLNAARALTALAVKARLDPTSGINIQPTWFIEMLNSLSFSDRTRALAALDLLTDTRNQSVLTQLRDTALPALAEMARWKTLAHALPAYILLGRVAGLTEDQIQDAWSKGDRESVIAQALKKTK